MTALVRYALGVPFIRDALSRSSVSLPGGRTFRSTDDLLVSWPPLVGGKTGHTRDAGWSQTAAAQRGGDHGLRRGARKRHARARGTTRCRSSSRSGSTSTARVQVIDRARVYATAETGLRPARRRARRTALARAHRSGSGRPLVERVVAPTALALPVAKGQRLGRVEVYDGNRLVASSTLVAAGRSRRCRAVWAKAKWYATQTARESAGRCVT